MWRRSCWWGRVREEESGEEEGRIRGVNGEGQGEEGDRKGRNREEEEEEGSRKGQGGKGRREEGKTCHLTMTLLRGRERVVSITCQFL